MFFVFFSFYKIVQKGPQDLYPILKSCTTWIVKSGLGLKFSVKASSNRLKARRVPFVQNKGNGKWIFSAKVGPNFTSINVNGIVNNCIAIIQALCFDIQLGFVKILIYFFKAVFVKTTGFGIMLWYFYFWKLCWFRSITISKVFFLFVYICFDSFLFLCLIISCAVLWLTCATFFF